MAYFKNFSNFSSTSPKRLSVLASGAAATSAAYALGTFPSLMTSQSISTTFDTPLPTLLRNTLDQDLNFSIARADRYGFIYHMRLCDAICDYSSFQQTEEDTFFKKETVEESEAFTFAGRKVILTRYYMLFNRLEKKLEIVFSHKGGFMSPYEILALESEILQRFKIKGDQNGLPAYIFTYTHPYQTLDHIECNDYFVKYIPRNNSIVTEYDYLVQVYVQITERLCSFQETAICEKLTEKVYFSSTRFSPLYSCSCDNFFCTGLGRVIKRKNVCHL